MALMMIGPRSTQQLEASSHIGLATSAIASVSIWLALPSRNFGLPAVSASDGENLSDSYRQIARRKDVAESSRYAADRLCEPRGGRKIHDSRPREWLRLLTSSRICRPTCRHSRQRILARPGCA